MSTGEIYLLGAIAGFSILLGLPVGRMRNVSTSAAAFLNAGAAGVLFALRVPTYATIGFIIGLKGFTAAVIGGIGSIPGAMAGGLVLGFAESYTQGYISTRWSDLIVFVILVMFLLFRPTGILGVADIRKV
jgi:branched-chain amino acid transport system permease protein